jgi:hypothetical protein
MKLYNWSDTLAKSKLSPERRARIQAEVEQEMLEMTRIARRPPPLDPTPVRPCPWRRARSERRGQRPPRAFGWRLAEQGQSVSRRVALLSEALRLNLVALGLVAHYLGPLRAVYHRPSRLGNGLDKDL